MKLKCLLFLFFPLSLNAQQAWDLFPLGQKTWFSVEDSLFQYYSDSTLISEEKQTHLFGTKSVYENFGECTEDILLEFWANENLEYSIFADTIYSNDDFFFSPIQSDTLKFFHKAPLGSVQYLPLLSGDSLMITCTELIEDEILGFTDSLKSFEIQFIQNGNPAAHPLNGEKIILGKNIGFVEWFSLLELHNNSENSQPHIMQGFEKEETNYGYTSSYLDFFHYEIGDVLKWHSYDRDSPTAEYSAVESWFIDTITDINLVSNLLQLSVNRTRYTEEYENDALVDAYTELGSSAIFSISQILMDSFLRTPLHHPTNFFENLRYLRQAGKINTEGITEIADFITPRQFSLSDCSTSSSVDLPGQFVLNTELGFKETQLNRGENGNYLLELQGYRSGDFMWGELDSLPIISSLQKTPELSLSISPNPAQSEIFIKSSTPLSKAYFQIFSADHRLVKSGTLVTDGRISLDLPEGFYILQLKSKNTILTEKLIIRY